MISSTRPFAATGAALAAVGALIVATPTIDFNHGVSAPGLTSVSSAIQLVSDWESEDSGDVDSGDYAMAYSGHGESEGHHHGGFGGFGGFITNFLDNNQAQVLAVTAMIPQFNLFSVPVGNSLLANAYYTGYDNGSGTVVTGVPGVIAYVTSQFGTTPTNILQSVVLGLTSLTPQVNIGPVAIGHGLLATAYFSGYNGSATGLPGVISYVTSQLGIQTTPAAAAKASTSVVAARAAAAAPVAADSSDAGTAKADTASAGRSAAGRLTAKTASAAGQAKAGAARAARAAARAS